MTKEYEKNKVHNRALGPWVKGAKGHELTMNVQILKKISSPPEPLKIKIKAKEARQRDPDWKSDSLMIWFYGIASYLWKYWGDELKRLDIDWPGFEKCLSAWKEDFILWSRDKIQWKEMIEDIRSHIPRYKKWLDRKRGKIKVGGVFPLRE